MTLNQTPNFDRLARIYRWCEYLALGPILERTRTHHLPALHHVRQALILGDGDGRFTAALLAANPQVHIHAIDASPAMLTQLRHRAGPANSPRLRTTRQDVRTFHSSLQEPTTEPGAPGLASETWVPNLKVHPQPGLIVTHFLLDCLTQPEVDALVTRLAAPLAPGALWLVSEFRIPDGPLHYPARLYIRTLYLAFRILTGLHTQRLPDHAAPLTRAGFQPTATHRKLGGILTTELWQKR